MFGVLWPKLRLHLEAIQDSEVMERDNEVYDDDDDDNDDDDDVFTIRNNQPTWTR